MFVGRRPDGSIYGVWTSAQPNDQDHVGIVELPETDPDVQAFVTRPINQFDPIADLNAKVTALQTDMTSMTGIASTKVTI